MNRKLSLLISLGLAAVVVALGAEPASAARYVAELGRYGRY